MRLRHRAILSALLCALVLAAAPGGAAAQSTDGYHAIQVFPVVVDSTSFSQRFTFRQPTRPVEVETPMTVSARYFPGVGTPEPAPLQCPDFVIPATGQRVFLSLREICPALVAGSHFGYLHTAESDPLPRPYAAYSRVSNPQGNGFSVEAFPAHTLTSGVGVVTGLRRRAATGGSPAFQSNCFVASLAPAIGPGPVTANTVDLHLYDKDDVLIGEINTSVASGRLLRFLDVFAAAGAPSGDHEDARVRITMVNGPGAAPLASFCTVQDNTSFGADFRIAKQEWGGTFSDSELAAHDEHVPRLTLQSGDTLRFAGETTRTFAIQAGASHNTHEIALRHPDVVQCELLDRDTQVRMQPAAGLEMRLATRVFDQNGVLAWQSLAGGSGTTGFDEVYLGDKQARNGGRNTTYWIEVESNGQNAGAVRAYALRCRSGSGHSFPNISHYQLPIDLF